MRERGRYNCRILGVSELKNFPVLVASSRPKKDEHQSPVVRRFGTFVETIPFAATSGQGHEL